MADDDALRRGFEVRRAVLGAEHVERSSANAVAAVSTRATAPR